MPEQAPGRKCATCGRPMLSQPVFNADPDGWRARGFQRQASGDDCNTCYQRSRRGHTRPAQPRHDREHVLAEWRRLRALGETQSVIAQHLGITIHALDGVLKRARRDGLIEQGKHGPNPGGQSGMGGPAKQLGPAELARLRRAVGLPAALPPDGAPCP